MEADREYTNGRIRVRPEQIEYLDNLLHQTWVEVSRARAKTKLVLGGAEAHNQMEDVSALVSEMNRELRLIKTIQDELRRTKEDMGLA